MAGFKNTQEYLQYLRSQINTPEANGLFRAIAGPEGTLKADGTFAYWRQFGGNDLNPAKLGPGHPNEVISKNGYNSAATGFAQFMPGTWNSANTALGGSLDFRKPEDQKVATLHLARKRTEDLGGLAYLKEKGLTPEFVAKLSPEWASLPTLDGVSYYGQPVKPYNFVKQKYDEGLKAGGSSATPSSTEVAQAPATQPQSTSPVVTKNDDGTQTVAVPGGVTVNLKINDKDEEEKPTILGNMIAALMKNSMSGIAGINTNLAGNAWKSAARSVFGDDDLLA